jgi:hypothetical protein
VIDFLSQFNPSILANRIEINEFSEINDQNIHIQDGPLACYVSHLRSMIQGSNFLTNSERGTEFILVIELFLVLFQII